MYKGPKIFALSSLAICALGSFASSPTKAQEAIVTQTLPPIAPAPETPFARSLIRLDDLEGQIRALTDRLERAEADLAKQKSENARLARLIDENSANKMASSETSTSADRAANAPVVADSSAAVPAPVASVATEPVQNLPVQSSSINTAASPAPVIQSSVQSAPTQSAQIIGAAPRAEIANPKEPLRPAPVLLAEARLLLQRSEFAAAEARLTSLTEGYPDALESVEGYWLLGETRFVQKAYNSAALAYVAYLTKAPNGPKASDSLLRLSSSFREIGDMRQRCLAFKAYQSRTPNPTPLQSARATAELAKGACN